MKLANEVQLTEAKFCRKPLVSASTGWASIAVCYLEPGHGGDHEGISFDGRKVSWNQYGISWGEMLI